MAISLPSPHLLLAVLSTPDCAVQGDSLQCRLLSLLHYLYVAGAVLAVLLLVVLIFAIHTWYSGRNSGEIPPARPTRRKPRA